MSDVNKDIRTIDQGNLSGSESHHSQFERTLGKFESFSVAFSFISITTGLFSTYGSMLASSGPVGIWTWPIVTVGTLLVALVFGLLASKIPLSGFSYQWASRLVNPVLGWWFGWASFAFLAIVTVAVDYGLAQVALFPLFGLEYSAARGGDHHRRTDFDSDDTGYLVNPSTH